MEAPKFSFKQFDFQNENYHLGHLIIDALRSRPNVVCQLDAFTGVSETNIEVLTRAVQFAKCLRRFGLKPGDMIAVSGRNNITIHIPLYASFMSGFTVAGVYGLLKREEIKTYFSKIEPRIAFCQKENYETYQDVCKELGLDTRVVSFDDDGEYTIKKFLQDYNADDEEFEPANFDQDKIYASLIPSGGTTGIAKLIAFKHKSWVNKMMELRALYARLPKGLPEDNLPYINLAPVQWVSGFLNCLAMPILHMTKIQSSGPGTIEHTIELINKYKPLSVIMTTINLNALLESGIDCDLTCFDSILVSGTKLTKDFYYELKKRMRPGGCVIETYGQTENMGPLFMPVPNLPPGCCGNGKYASFKLKLVDVKSREEITEPNVPGELLTKGLCFTEYYKDPEKTASAFTEDGWYKTGDLLRRDEHDNYYYVERLQLMFNGQVSVSEIEEVIRAHPAVREVCVTATRTVFNPTDVIIACVVKRPGADVTAQDIQDLVTEKLPKTHKPAGIAFFDELPTTSAGKIARGSLNYQLFCVRPEEIIPVQ